MLAHAQLQLTNGGMNRLFLFLFWRLFGVACLCLFFNWFILVISFLRPFWLLFCFLLLNLPGDDLMTQSTSAVQGGRRKRTDLIPTIPIHRGEGDRSPRSPLYGSSSGASSSRGSVNRSTGMSVSMSRLDQLSQPRRRLSQNQLPSPSTPLQPLHETETQQPTASTQNKTASNSSTTRSSRPTSRTHQTSSSTTTASSPSSPQGTIAARGNRSMSKSMSHLAPGRPSSSAKASTPIDGSTPPTPTRHGGATTTTRAERLRQKARQHASQRPQHGMDGVRRVSNGALKKTRKILQVVVCLSVCVQTAFPFFFSVDVFLLAQFFILLFHASALKRK